MARIALRKISPDPLNLSFLGYCSCLLVGAPKNPEGATVPRRRRKELTGEEKKGKENKRNKKEERTKLTKNKKMKKGRKRGREREREKKKTDKKRTEKTKARKK